MSSRIWIAYGVEHSRLQFRYQQYNCIVRRYRNFAGTIMTSAIITPLTQALEEGKLTREELKAFMRRSNWPAIRRLILWVAILAGSTYLINLTWNSWLIWPAMFLQGIIIVHHFSLQHECVHYTVFRTRWLNDVVGNICGFIIMLPNRHFRYEHCDHHTYTQLAGDDPELASSPLDDNFRVVNLMSTTQ
jgi:fatty acid desaturase